MFSILHSFILSHISYTGIFLSGFLLGWFMIPFVKWLLTLPPTSPKRQPGKMIAPFPWPDPPVEDTRPIYVESPCITVDHVGKITQSVMRTYRNGVITVQGINSWFEARPDGSFVTDDRIGVYLRTWRRL